MSRKARALSDPVGCLKKFDVAMEAGGATVVLAAEDKSVPADDRADFTAADLSAIDDSRCGSSVKSVYGFHRVLSEFVALAKNSNALVRAAANKNLKGSTRLQILKHAQDIAIKMSISDQTGGSGEASGRRHALETRQEESDDEEYKEAEGDQETEVAGEGDGDGKDGEQRDGNVAAAAGTQKAAVDTHDLTAAAKTAAQEPSAPHAEAQPTAGANDENAEASDEVACSTAVGLETVADDSPAKGKKYVPSGAGSVAFVCAVSWMQCKECDLKSVKQAALLAGANDLSVVLYLAVWKHIVTAAMKGHDAAKIELQVAKHFEDAKKAAVTKNEKSRWMC
ncbi:unnamed protein product [Closterium sp. Naga37s-1]|nr:unnamed protein product [Closterium sp. Naga37s-1]